MPTPLHGDLTAWAKQGVFLLNAILTVREGKSNSHQKQGWEEFSDRVISAINKETSGVVFMLWGKKAHDKAKMVDRKKHLVLENVHPSPLAGTGFRSVKDFGKANQYLID
jgi:uracil-DNA glycosylase